MSYVKKALIVGISLVVLGVAGTSLYFVMEEDGDVEHGEGVIAFGRIEHEIEKREGGAKVTYTVRIYNLLSNRSAYLVAHQYFNGTLRTSSSAPLSEAYTETCERYDLVWLDDPQEVCDIEYSIKIYNVPLSEEVNAFVDEPFIESDVFTLSVGPLGP